MAPPGWPGQGSWMRAVAGHVVPCTVAVACQGSGAKQSCPSDSAVRYVLLEARIHVKETFLCCKAFQSLHLEVFKSIANSDERNSEIFSVCFCLYFCIFLSSRAYLKWILTVEGISLEK